MIKYEIWNSINSLNLKYSASINGEIKSINYNRTGKEGVLSPTKFRTGYLYVCIRLNGVSKSCMVHRLVAEAFIPNPENKTQVNHINGIKTDNRVENLEWVCNRENAVHARRNKKKSSSFIGVCWDKENKNWKAQIYINKKHIHLGSFKIESEAGDAYVNALKNY